MESGMQAFHGCMHQPEGKAEEGSTQVDPSAGGVGAAGSSAGTTCRSIINAGKSEVTEAESGGWVSNNFLQEWRCVVKKNWMRSYWCTNKLYQRVLMSCTVELSTEAIS